MPRAGDSHRTWPRATAAVRLSVLLLALVSLGVLAHAARAAKPLSPDGGERVGSTPTLSWQTGPNEDANLVELSRSPERQDDGSFVDDPDKLIGILDVSQKSYTVPASDRVLAGTWYWHLQTDDFDREPCCSLWTQTRRLVVADEPIRAAGFAATYLRRIDSVAARFTYSDNSASLDARYRIEFRKRRHGRRLASISGSVDRRDLLDGQALVTHRRPRKLRRGERYFVRLVLLDAAGHKARSAFRRIKIRR